MKENHKKSSKIMFAVNFIFIAAIFVLNYFYQLDGFDFTLKCVCSSAFALLGLINLIYALITKQSNRKFYITMSAGLLLAMLGDVFINSDFIIGAATFALGHVCFIIAYCFLQKMKALDYIISGILFGASSSFLMFSPLLSFDEPVFKAVCIIYALIISTMLGKAVGNFIRQRNGLTATIATASLLFCFSDLMLVFDWFIGLWSWTDHACMGTYYPALCFLAFAMIINMTLTKKKNLN